MSVLVNPSVNEILNDVESGFYTFSEPAVMSAIVKIINLFSYMTIKNNKLSHFRSILVN